MSRARAWLLTKSAIEAIINLELGQGRKISRLDPGTWTETGESS